MGRVRATVALAIAALILVPSLANAQFSATGPATSFQGVPTLGNPIFDQFADCTGSGAASQQFPDFGDAVLQSADDFGLTSEQTLAEVVALGSFGNPGAAAIDSITIEVYDTDGPGGLPGTLLCSETGLASANGPSDSALHLTLDESCTLGSGSYWLSVLPVMPFGGGAPGQWFWSSNNSANGSQFAFRDPDQLLGPGPCNDWGLGQSTCGIGTTFPDLCMGLGAPAVQEGGPGTPAVGTTGAIVMLLVVMAISFFYLRRRQTA